MLAAARAKLRDPDGFALIEMLIASTVLAVGMLATLATFSTGYLTLNRANTQATATMLADQTMETYRGKQFAAISVGTTTTPYSVTSTPASPDGRTYSVRAVVTATTATNTVGLTARSVKVVTVAVTDAAGRQWVTEQSTFESLTG